MKISSDDQKAITVIIIGCTVIAALILAIDLHITRVLLVRARKLDDALREVEGAFSQGLGRSSVDFVLGDSGVVRDAGMATPFDNVPHLESHRAESGYIHRRWIDGGSGNPGVEIPEVSGEVESER